MRELKPSGENWKNPEQRQKLLAIEGLFGAIQHFFISPSGKSVKMNPVFDEKGHPLWPGQADIKSADDIDLWIEQKNRRGQLVLKVNVPIVEMFAEKRGREPRRARYEWRFEIDQKGLVTISVSGEKIMPGLYASDERSFDLSEIIRDFLRRN